MSSKKVVITFGSNYGYTEQYAKWIAEDLRASELAPEVELVAVTDATDEIIESADLLVVGASYLGGFLTGAPTLRKRKEAILKVPHRFFYTVCFNGLAVYPREYLDKRVMKSYKEDVAGGRPAYHFRGGLDMNRMTKPHRTALGLVKTAYKLKPKQNEYDKQLIEAFDNGGGDYSNREDTKPLVAEILQALAE